MHSSFQRRLVTLENIFRSGNEEGIYSNILRDLLNDYEFQDKKNSSRFEDDHEFQRRLHFR